MLQNRSLPTGSNARFSRVPQVQINRSAFKRSHNVKSSFDCDLLVPCYVDEVLPGDTFSLSVTSVARLTSPLYPIMDNLYLDYFFFYVPNRILWTNWERFMGAQDDPDDPIDYTVPQITVPAGGWVLYSLADYMGLPVGNYTDTTMTPNALHFRGYAMIWNQWFRDQNLQDSIPFDTDDGPDVEADYKIQKRNKSHDYFTSALPFAQKGTEIDLPLGTTAPVLASRNLQTSSTGTNPTFSSADITNVEMQSRASTAELDINATPAYTQTLRFGTTTGIRLMATEAEDVLSADLSSATASTINELREAFQLQIMMEKDARSGTRYCELLMSHFGVVDPSHAVLQRPEYLGGGSSAITVTPIPQTSQSDTTELGTLQATGYGVSQGIGFNKSFTEHGIIIGLVCANLHRETYQQGLNKMWSRQTREEFYFPALANLGEQAILKKEIYATDNGTTNDTVFGYAERWAEYRFKPSIVTGQLRSYGGSSLDAWHLAQDFDSIPSLNSDFIESAVPLDRVLALPDEKHVLLDAFFDVTCVRPMPMYSIPGLIDHF